jgi:chromosomal replication initiation ATPase DnaA
MIKPPIKERDVIIKAAELFGITLAAIESPRRTDTIAIARMASMFFLRKHFTYLTLREIGQAYKPSRHYSTVLNACWTIQNIIDIRQAAYIEKIEKLDEWVKENADLST